MEEDLNKLEELYTYRSACWSRLIIVSNFYFLSVKIKKISSDLA